MEALFARLNQKLYALTGLISKTCSTHGTKDECGCRMTYLGVPSIATMFSIAFIFLISFYTPLHVSALMGHPHLEYTQSLMEAITPITDPFLGYTIYTDPLYA
jgi:hypothetical protein